MSNPVISSKSYTVGVSQQNFFQDLFNTTANIIDGIINALKGMGVSKSELNNKPTEPSLPPSGPTSPTHQNINKAPDYIIHLYGDAQLGLSYDDTSSENDRKVVSKVNGNAKNLEMLGVGDQFAIEAENGVKKVMIYSRKSNPSDQKEPPQPRYVFILPSGHTLGLRYNSDPTTASKGEIYQLESPVKDLGYINVGDHVEVKKGTNGNNIVVITKKVEPFTHSHLDSSVTDFGDIQVGDHSKVTPETNGNTQKVEPFTKQLDVNGDLMVENDNCEGEPNQYGKD